MSRTDLWLALVLTAASATAQAQPRPVADPGFDAITSRVGTRSHDASLAAMEAWIEAHPSDPNAGRGLVWMGDIRFSDGKLDEAYGYFARAERDYGHTEWGLHGRKGRADIDLVQHRYGPAIAAYDSLAAGPTAYWQYIGRTMAHGARKGRVLYAAYLFCLAALGGGLSLRLWRGRRRLWPLPEELVYVAPLAVLMLVASAGQPREEANAVCLVALGGVLILWANGVDLRLNPPRSLVRRLAEAVLGLVQAAALLYCSVMASGVWTRFEETLKAGADR